MDGRGKGNINVGRLRAINENLARCSVCVGWRTAEGAEIEDINGGLLGELVV